jgi:hypothetical protein
MGILREIYNYRQSVNSKVHVDELVDRMSCSTNFKVIKNDDTSLGIIHEDCTKDEMIDKLNKVISQIVGIDSSLNPSMFYHIYEVNGSHTIVKLF